MNKNIRKSIFLCIFGILMISFCAAGVNSNEGKFNDDISLNPQHLDKGQVKFGIVTIDSENVEGIDQEEYLGILSDINLEISGESSIIIVPIPFMIFSTVFDTQENVSIHMDNAWVSVTTTDEYVSIIAFAKTISWEWN